LGNLDFYFTIYRYFGEKCDAYLTFRGKLRVFKSLQSIVDQWCSNSIYLQKKNRKSLHRKSFYTSGASKTKSGKIPSVKDPREEFLYFDFGPSAFGGALISGKVIACTPSPQPSDLRERTGSTGALWTQRNFYQGIIQYVALSLSAPSLTMVANCCVRKRWWLPNKIEFLDHPLRIINNEIE
jgi:hypothetical protein